MTAHWQLELEPHQVVALQRCGALTVPDLRHHDVVSSVMLRHYDAFVIIPLHFIPLVTKSVVNFTAFESQILTDSRCPVCAASLPKLPAKLDSELQKSLFNDHCIVP
jgi:hypothetical protein